jgi:hypothetical protein
MNNKPRRRPLMAVQKPANPTKKGASNKSTTPKPVLTSDISTGGEQTNTGEANPHQWPIVEILWVDAVADGLLEWMDPQDTENIKPVQSLVVGYLLHQTDTHTTVASLINEESTAHILCIPNQIILKTRHWQGTTQ